MNRAVKQRLKTLLRGPVASSLLANFLRLVMLSARKIHDHPGEGGKIPTAEPVIYTSWHGHSYLTPFLFRSGDHPTLIVARHGDGRMVGNAMNILGMPLIFGSGSTDTTDPSKGGARAFLTLLKLLRARKSIKITADVPKISHVVGQGVILLARKSGCAIVPLAMASSRRRFVNSWDRMQINLPFSTIAFVQGEAIHVPNDDTPLSLYQTRLQQALEVANQRALDLADGKIRL